MLVEDAEQFKDSFEKAQKSNASLVSDAPAVAEPKEDTSAEEPKEEAKEETKEEAKEETKEETKGE
jgi:Ran-binding protein 1